jgi:hypothetical protein
VPLPDSDSQRLAPAVAWEYWNGTRWATLTTLAADDAEARALDPIVEPGDLQSELQIFHTIALSSSSNDDALWPQLRALTFTVPDDMEPYAVADIEARWIRVRVVSGGFGYQQTLRWNVGDQAETVNQFTITVPRPPALSEFRMGFRWEHGPFAPEAVLAFNDFQYRDETDAATWPGTSFQPFTPPDDLTPALYVGFDKPLPVDQLGIFVDVAEEIGEPPGPALIWEHWDGGTWQPLAVEDETRRLRKTGLVNLIGPQGSRPLPRFGTDRYWLRARLKEDGPPGSPIIRQFLPNAVWTVQQQTVVDDPIGTSAGGPDQVYRFRLFPVLAGERIDVRELSGKRANTEWRMTAMELWPGDRRVLSELEARLGREGAATEIEYGPLRLKRDRNKQVTEVWVRWDGKPDLNRSGPNDRHYTLDRATGRLRFGSGARVPPAGAPIVARRYQTGGGSTGNVPAGAITQLLGAVSGVAGVRNPVASGGGADGETLDGLRERGPRTLRHRGRGLTARDLAALAREASPAVARARALPARAADGRRRAGYVTLVITPASKDPRPFPSFGLREQVRRFIEARGAATIAGLERIEITGPRYRPIDVDATIVPRDPSESGDVERRARAVLERLLHPLDGGPDGTGWDAGQDCWLSDLAAALERVTGVDYVRDLQVSVDGQIGGERVAIADDQIVVAGELRLRLAGDTARTAR